MSPKVKPNVIVVLTVWLSGERSQDATVGNNRLQLTLRLLLMLGSPFLFWKLHTIPTPSTHCNARTPVVRAVRIINVAGTPWLRWPHPSTTSCSRLTHTIHIPLVWRSYSFARCLGDQFLCTTVTWRGRRFGVLWICPAALGVHIRGIFHDPGQYPGTTPRHPGFSAL